LPKPWWSFTCFTWVPACWKHCHRRWFLVSLGSWLASSGVHQFICV
jgi:hypothetical protein